MISIFKCTKNYQPKEHLCIHCFKANDVFGPFPSKSPGLEGHSSWQEEAADKEAKRGSTNEDGAWWTGLILPQVMGETRDRGQCPCMPSQLTSPPSSPTFPPPPFYPHQPPQQNDQRLTPPGWKGEGGGVGGGGEEITWTTATSQLIERPLGG